MPFLVFRRDHLQSTSAIICGSGSFPVWGSFAALYSTQESRVPLGYRLGQLLRFFRALQTSRVLHNSIVHA